jgi:ubiquinone/menaquinone biosynthesis C-methylase UbiE
VNAPPFDLSTVEAITPAVLSRGHRILQMFRYAPTDWEQAAILLWCMAPEHGATVLDAGCGIGEVSRLMQLQRPDLHFVLVNISPLQMAYCPNGEHFTQLVCDFHDLPLDDERVDAVMFSSALVQMDEALALAQAHRVLRPGGTLLVNEPVRDWGDGDELEHACADHWCD